MNKAMLALAAVGALALGACGDDDDDGATSFVADADALCAERNTAVVSAYQEAGGASASDSAVLEAHAAAEEELATGLAEIEASSELEQPFEELVALREQRAELMAAASESVQAENADVANVDRALADLYQDEAHAVARALGMSDCADRLPAADEEEVTAAIERALAQEGAASVEVYEVEGHDVFAEAEVVPSGGRYDREALRVQMIRSEDGEWELDDVNPFGSGESG